MTDGAAALPGAGALASHSAAADPSAVAALLHAHWGLAGRLTPVAGERDSNFRLDSADAQYLVKVTHPDENLRAVAAQCAVLEHVQAVAPTLPVQRAVQTRDGAAMVIYPPDPRRRVRVTAYLPGTLRRDTPWQPALAGAIGATAAELAHALRAFAHPGAEQRLLWDLRQAQALRPLLTHLADDPLRDTVSVVLDRHARILDGLAGLPDQPIHNDLNPTNLLVSADGESLIGVLDFGDMIVAPAVVDLAVACAYLTDAPDLVGAIHDCVAGYAAVTPLNALERAVLPDLIATRWAMTVLITEWRSRLQPDNAAYILRNNPASRRGLTALSGDGGRRLRTLVTEGSR